jgi:alcohol dehydrogenase (cytochrome c)
MLGVSAMLAECSVAIAGDTVLKALKPVTDEMLQRPDPGDWLMRRGDYRAWGYSTLDQIRAGNVGALKLAWAWNMEPGYQEEAPLVHDGVIFLGNPQNVVQALDGRTGDLLWEYRRELPKIEGGYHNDLFDRARGTIALYADKVILASADAHVVALDARTGKVVWDTTVADYRRGYTFTGGPMVAKGKVIAGISGCTNPDTAGGCFIVALDANTGTQLWRTQTIAQPGSPGDESWNGLPLEKRNGGSVWTTGSYDPSLNLLFWGTGGPIPHTELVRGSGDGRSSTPIQRWLSTPTPARSSGTTSSCPATTGISIMCSSRFSWTSTWEIARGRRCWQSESPASSGRSTGAQANSCGRAKQPTRPCSRASIQKPERSPSTRA